MTSLTDQEKEVINKEPIGRNLGAFYEFFSVFTSTRPPISFKDIISSVGEDEGTFLMKLKLKDMLSTI